MSIKMSLMQSLFVIMRRRISSDFRVAVGLYTYYYGFMLWWNYKMSISIRTE